MRLNAPLSSPSLQTPKVGLNGFWDPNGAVGVHIHCRGLGPDGLKGPFQLKRLYSSSGVLFDFLIGRLSWLLIQAFLMLCLQLTQRLARLPERNCPDLWKICPLKVWILDAECHQNELGRLQLGWNPIESTIRIDKWNTGVSVTKKPLMLFSVAQQRENKQTKTPQNSTENKFFMRNISTLLCRESSI